MLSRGPKLRHGLQRPRGGVPSGRTSVVAILVVFLKAEGHLYFASAVAPGLVSSHIAPVTESGNRVAVA